VGKKYRRLLLHLVRRKCTIAPPFGVLSAQHEISKDTMKVGNTLLLLLLPVWIIFTLIAAMWGEKRRARRLGTFITQRLAPLLLSNYSQTKQTLKHFLFLCATGLIGFALTAPKWGYKEEERHVQGIDLLIAVDVSKSMLAEDIKPNRLERTKLAITDLAKSFAGHRLGLIAFAGNAFLQCPLTLDHNAFIQTLNALDTDTIPVPGTAIDAAIALAEKVYAQTPNQKLLFLFSDGEELADSAVAGAQRAKEKNICIYTIGIGSAEGSTIPIPAPKTGKTEFLRDRSGQIVKTALDEKTLKEIATTTEGHYVHLSAAGLINLQKNITSRFPLLKESCPENTYTEKVYQERYQPFLLLGFLLLLLEMLISTYKKPEKYTVSIYYRLSLILLFFFIFLPDHLLARESQGEIFYKNGAFGEALEFYNRELEKRRDDPELLYNKGTTCLALKRYEESGQAFRAANVRAPVELQKKIFYNLGNALFEQGKSLPDPKGTLAAWKESLRHFRSAVDLDEHFEEAKKNARYVEEEIKKLENQQKDQQNPNSQDQQDNQKDQQNPNSQDQQDNQKDQQNPDNQNQQDNQKDQQNPNSQDQQDNQKIGRAHV
jgi:Ca-activated chloride channel family protein